MTSDTLKYCLSILWFFSFLPGLAAQNTGAKKIALYAPESTFSLSLIEKKLYSLKDENGHRLLKKKGVLNINDMLAAEQNQVAASEAKKRIIFEMPVPNDDEVERVIRELRDSISRYELFLQVNTDSFQDLIEYQFILYPVKHGKTIKESQVLDFYEKSVSTRLFSKEEGVATIEREIVNALKELFSESHFIPKAKISVVEENANTRNRSSVETVAVIVGDTLHLDAFYTIDEDTPTKYLTYEWIRIQDAGSLPDEHLKVIGAGMNCKVIPNETDTFLVELRVFDGVEATLSNALSKDTIAIIAYPKPLINIVPSRIQSFYVQDLVKEPEFYENKWDQIRIVSFSGQPDISSVDSKMIFKAQQLPEEARIGLNIADTILLGLVDYENIKSNKKYQLRADFENGVHTDLTLNVNHKVFYPYFLEIGFAHSDLEIDSTLGLPGGIQNWNEPRLGINFKVLQRLEVGLTGSYRKMTWENADNEIYSLTSFGEISANYDILQKKSARVGVMAFGKIFQVDEPQRGYTQLVGGLRGHIGVKMFQGLSEVLLNITLISQPLNKGFLTEYTEWWNLGFRVYLPVNSF